MLEERRTWKPCNELFFETHFAVKYIIWLIHLGRCLKSTPLIKVPFKPDILLDIELYPERCVRKRFGLKQGEVRRVSVNQYYLHSLLATNVVVIGSRNLVQVFKMAITQNIDTIYRVVRAEGAVWSPKWCWKIFVEVRCSIDAGSWIGIHSFPWVEALKEESIDGAPLTTRKLGICYHFGNSISEESPSHP